MALPKRADILEIIKNNLQPDDFAHCARVERVAAELSDRFSIDRDKASIAGLMHDFCRYMSNEELLNKSKEFGLSISDVDIEVPYLLHGPLGAKIIQVTFPDTDSDVLHAIEVHTFGSAQMNNLDMLIYVADLIEPGREIEGLENIRKVAKVSLEQAFRQAYAFTVLQLVIKQKKIHPATVDVWNKLIAI